MAHLLNPFALVVSEVDSTEGTNLEEQLEAMEGKYHKRFSLLPGLSGLAQVRGRRKLNWLKQLQFDSEYVDKVSLCLDFFIFIKTFLVLFSVKEIYGNESDNWRNYLKK